MEEYDVIVVGGGISGLLSALALGREGENVLLLERNGFFGGPLRSYVVDGWRVDVGPHALTYIHDGPLSRLMGKYVDRLPEILPYGDYFVRAPGKFSRFPWTVQDWVSAGILPFSDRMRLLKTMASAMASQKDETLEKTLFDVFEASGLSPRAWRFVDALAYFMSGRGMREAPAWRMVKGARYLEEGDSKLGLLQRLARLSKFIRYDGAYHQGYPREGVGAITDAVLESMPDNVLLMCGVEVERVNADSGRVSSVESSLGEHAAKTVVYSAEAVNLPSLVDGLPKDYVDSLKTLRQSQTLTIWLGLSEPAPELSYTGSEIWFDEPKPYWGMPTSNYNPSFAPDGRQLACFASFIDGNEKREERLLLDAVYSAIPSIEDKVVFSHKQVCVPEKAAIIVGAEFPKVKSPVSGLYIVGTDADSRSMGATRAAFSVETLLREMGVP